MNRPVLSDIYILCIASITLNAQYPARIIFRSAMRT